MSNALNLIEPQVVPPLHPEFRPAVLANRAFVEATKASGEAVPLVIGLEREGGLRSVYKTQVYAPDSEMAAANLVYAERLVKTLLWIRGGWKIIVGGPEEIGRHIQQAYSEGGARSFDAELMGGVYEEPFTVEITDADAVGEPREQSVRIGRHLEGCRIGLDLGASDRKVAAVIDGEDVYSEEVPWDPKNQSDPQYHYDGIKDAFDTAAAHMPRVDAIGVSAAGIYINNRAMVASLFRGIPEDLFESRIKDIFLNIRDEDWPGVPIAVANDGDVTALAGAMSLEDNSVLGVAMGSSEAGGYVDAAGNVTGWLNELAFVPVDLNPAAPVDEWSGDYGCGVQYFSQQAVVRLAPAAGITLDESKAAPEQLADIQEMFAAGDERPQAIYETIGCYLGYAVAHYADFYDIHHLLILGRVTSGRGGQVILKKAQEVLEVEFPELAEQISMNLPDESERRVGQAIAAASLANLLLTGVDQYATA